MDLDEVSEAQREPGSPISPTTPHLTTSPVSTSTAPAHLLLNLHILDFIECARTIPLPYYAPDCSCQYQYQCRSVPITSNGAVSHAADRDDQTYAYNWNRRNKGRPALLHKARQLFLEAKQLLRPADRMAFLGELARVTAIIAHAHPEKSELAPFFEQARREAVADQVEAAFLGMYVYLKPED